MRGRLLSLLRAARSATNILPASVPGGRSLAPLSPRTLAGFALDIACGMEYIAGRRVSLRYILSVESLTNSSSSSDCSSRSGSAQCAARSQWHVQDL